MVDNLLMVFSLIILLILIASFFVVANSTSRLDIFLKRLEYLIAREFELVKEQKDIQDILKSKASDSMDGTKKLKL